MFLIYNLFSLISLIAYLPWLLFKKGPENRLTYLSERFGMSKYKNADIWIHAVSVGEVIASLPFFKTLRREFPELKIVFSTTTYTGQKIAHEKFLDADRIMYMPWDTWLTVNWAVKMIRPKIFLTIETELWPALFRALKRSETRVVLLNGRISPGSFKGYKLIRPFMKRILSHIDFLYMQGKIDAERIIDIGADVNKVGIMGNFKFDIELDRTKSIQWMDNIKGQVILAGSTHKGEEEIILDAYEEVKQTFPDLKLILAPRHPERFNEVEEILKKRNLSFIRRTQISLESGVWSLESNDVILLDTIGELSQIFSRTIVSFIGGSLLPYGGHNFLEPAYWGKPIIFGKHMGNFPFAEEFLRQGAAVMVKNAKDASSIIKNLLEDPEKAKEMGQRAKSIVDNNRGAVKKALDLVRSFVGTTQQHL